MPLSFHQLYEKILSEDTIGGPGGIPPCVWFGLTPAIAPRSGTPPMPMPGGPPGMTPPPAPGGMGADPNAPQGPVKVKATRWLDFMEKALDKMDGKVNPDDVDKGEEESQNQQHVSSTATTNAPSWSSRGGDTSRQSCCSPAMAPGGMPSPMGGTPLQLLNAIIIF